MLFIKFNAWNTWNSTKICYKIFAKLKEKCANGKHTINKSLRKMCQMEQWRSKGWKAVQVIYGINIIKGGKDERHNLSLRFDSISVILHKELYHLWFPCNGI